MNFPHLVFPVSALLFTRIGGDLVIWLLGRVSKLSIVTKKNHLFFRGSTLIGMTIPSNVRESAYERWGRACFICGASEPSPTFAQRWRQGISEIRMPLHHLNGDEDDHRVTNLLPVCEAEQKDGGNGCHAKIHAGGDGDCIDSSTSDFRDISPKKRF